MAFLTWSNNYSVRVAAMDEQHRRLIDLINQLHDAQQGGKDNQAIAQVLASLIDYTKTHFAAEERLMQSCAFPSLTAHKAEHVSFTRQAMDVQRQFQNGQASITTELLSFLRQWLINHIMASDKAYGTFLAKRVA